MSDDGRLPPAWGPPPPPHEPSNGGLAGLFAQPSAPPPPAPPDPALLAAQYQAQQEAAAPPSRTAGAHRARRQPARYIIPGIIAVLAIVAIWLGISGWLRPNDKTVAQPTPSQVSVSTPTATATQSSPSPTPTASTSPTVKTPSPTPTPTPTKSVVPPPPPAAPALVHAPTVVLNETPTHGLAASVAARLRTKGWTVTGTGNWHGNIGSTTVYYPRGLEAAARRLAYDLGVSRLRPVVAGMLTDRLTVVLTSNPYA